MTSHEFARVLLAGPDEVIGVFAEDIDEWPYLAEPAVTQVELYGSKSLAIVPADDLANYDGVMVATPRSSCGECDGPKHQPCKEDDCPERTAEPSPN